MSIAKTKTFIQIFVPALFILSMASMPASAAVITVISDGTDNMPNGTTENPALVIDWQSPEANFFNISFESGNSAEYISSVRIDLRAGSDSDAFFDPSDGHPEAGDDTNGGGGRGFGPIIGSDTLGLSASEVTFSLDTTTLISPILEIAFLPFSFVSGERLAFGIDIDRLGDNLGNNAGGLLGVHGVGFSVAFALGSQTLQLSSNFVSLNNRRSVAQTEFLSTVTAIPAPTTWLLCMAGLIAFRGQRVFTS